MPELPDTKKQSAIKDSEADESDEWAQSTLQGIEAAAGYHEGENSGSGDSSPDSYVTAKEWQSDDDKAPKNPHDPHQTDVQRDSEQLTSDQLTSASRKPSPTPSLTPSEIIRFSTLPRPKPRRKKGKGVVENEIPDMPVSDDEKDSNEQFEQIYGGGYGSKPNWIRGSDNVQEPPANPDTSRQVGTPSSNRNPARRTDQELRDLPANTPLYIELPDQEGQSALAAMQRRQIAEWAAVAERRRPYDESREQLQAHTTRKHNYLAPKRRFEVDPDERPERESIRPGHYHGRGGISPSMRTIDREPLSEMASNTTPTYRQGYNPVMITPGASKSSYDPSAPIFRPAASERNPQPLPFRPTQARPAKEVRERTKNDEEDKINSYTSSSMSPSPYPPYVGQQPSKTLQSSPSPSQVAREPSLSSASVDQTRMSRVGMKIQRARAAVGNTRELLQTLSKNEHARGVGEQSGDIRNSTLNSTIHDSRNTAKTVMDTEEEATSDDLVQKAIKEAKSITKELEEKIMKEVEVKIMKGLDEKITKQLEAKVPKDLQEKIIKKFDKKNNDFKSDPTIYLGAAAFAKRASKSNKVPLSVDRSPGSTKITSAQLNHAKDKEPAPEIVFKRKKSKSEEALEAMVKEVAAAETAKKVADVKLAMKLRSATADDKAKEDARAEVKRAEAYLADMKAYKDSCEKMATMEDLKEQQKAAVKHKNMADIKAAMKLKSATADEQEKADAQADAKRADAKLAHVETRLAALKADMKEKEALQAALTAEQPSTKEEKAQGDINIGPPKIQSSKTEQPKTDTTVESKVTSGKITARNSQESMKSVYLTPETKSSTSASSIDSSSGQSASSDEDKKNDSDTDWVMLGNARGSQEQLQPGDMEVVERPHLGQEEYNGTVQKSKPSHVAFDELSPVLSRSNQCPVETTTSKISYLEGKLRWSLSGSLRKSASSTTYNSETLPKPGRPSLAMSTSRKSHAYNPKTTSSATKPLPRASALLSTSKSPSSTISRETSTPTNHASVRISPTPVSPLQTFPSSSYIIFPYHDLVSTNIQQTLGKGRDEAFDELFNILLKEDVKNMLGRKDIVDEVHGMVDVETEDGSGSEMDRLVKKSRRKGKDVKNVVAEEKIRVSSVLGEKDQDSTIGVSRRKEKGSESVLKTSGNSGTRGHGSVIPPKSKQTKGKTQPKHGDVGYNPLKSPSVEDFFASTEDPSHPDTLLPGPLSPASSSLSHSTTPQSNFQNYNYTRTPSVSPTLQTTNFRTIKDPTQLFSTPLTSLTKAATTSSSSTSKKTSEKNDGMWRPSPTSFDTPSIILSTLGTLHDPNPDNAHDDAQILIHKVTKAVFVRRQDGRVYAVEFGDASPKISTSSSGKTQTERKVKMKDSKGSKDSMADDSLEARIALALQDEVYENRDRAGNVRAEEAQVQKQKQKRKTERERERGDLECGWVLL
ncbi:hypothetical protein K491DRAFT_761958 [Lophiostoma macrostomum CBS 122681]|uniref:Uncharacterized protein n=1 Tax=Lophiostoma macrostomum CBS 122681 TaxID=1314788 RepID=A0A6A6SQL5_9PLEO|nr:hypothetical protein K491DRAFT_761958 [Lophiostoma macrostomum CBS 122681]